MNRALHTVVVVSLIALLACSTNGQPSPTEVPSKGYQAPATYPTPTYPTRIPTTTIHPSLFPTRVPTKIPTPKPDNSTLGFELEDALELLRTLEYEHVPELAKPNYLAIESRYSTIGISHNKGKVTRVVMFMAMTENEMEFVRDTLALTSIMELAAGNGDITWIFDGLTRREQVRRTFNNWHGIEVEVDAVREGVVANTVQIRILVTPSI